MVAGGRPRQNPKKFSRNLPGGHLWSFLHDFVSYGFPLWDNMRKAMDFVELE